MTNVDESNTVIIGAGAAGLACAVCLKRYGVNSIILDESPGIGSTWQRRYDRLRLHTTRKYSHLPYLKIPASYPRYVPKDLYAAYLRDYAAAFGIQPIFDQKVIRVQQQRGNDWITETNTRKYASKNLVIATGCAARPVAPLQNTLQAFKGQVLHSCHYTNGRTYANKKVLVIGFGNSACEIALCLYEHGALPCLSVRGCVNILPREIAGISVVEIAILEKWLIDLSPSVADAANAPLLALINGNINRYGLKKCDHGPLTQIAKRHRIPLIDIGTMELIKRGKITVFPAIQTVENNTVLFADGRAMDFDAIILATGYRPGFAEFLADHDQVCDEEGIPLSSGQESALRGLYFCGFRVSPTGMLREIGVEAKKIAASVFRRDAGI